MAPRRPPGNREQIHGEKRLLSCGAVPYVWGVCVPEPAVTASPDRPQRRWGRSPAGLHLPTALPRHGARQAGSSPACPPGRRPMPRALPLSPVGNLPAPLGGARSCCPPPRPPPPPLPPALRGARPVPERHEGGWGAGRPRGVEEGMQLVWGDAVRESRAVR